MFTFSREEVFKAISIARFLQKIRPLSISFLQEVYGSFASLMTRQSDISITAGIVVLLGYDLHCASSINIPPPLLNDPSHIVEALVSLPEEILDQSLRLLCAVTTHLRELSVPTSSKLLAILLKPLVDMLKYSTKVSVTVRKMFRAITNCFSSKTLIAHDRDALFAVEDLIVSTVPLLSSIEDSTFILADCLRVKALLGEFVVPKEAFRLSMSRDLIVSAEGVWGHLYLASTSVQILVADGKIPKREWLNSLVELLEIAFAINVVAEEQEEIVVAFVKSLWPYIQDKMNFCFQSAVQRLSDGHDVNCALLLRSAWTILHMVAEVRAFLQPGVALIILKEHSSINDAFKLVEFICETVQSRNLSDHDCKILHAVLNSGTELLDTKKKRPRSSEISDRLRANWLSLTLRILSDISVISEKPQMWLLLLNTLKASLTTAPVYGSLGNAIGVIAAIIRNVLRKVLECELAANAIAVLEDCLKTECRILTIIAGSKELSRHSHLFVGAILDCVSGIHTPRSVRELLLPGIFSLIDACTIRQKKAVPVLLNPVGKVCLAEMTAWYNEDFKFKGNV